MVCCHASTDDLHGAKALPMSPQHDTPKSKRKPDAGVASPPKNASPGIAASPTPRTRRFSPGRAANAFRIGRSGGTGTARAKPSSGRPRPAWHAWTASPSRISPGSRSRWSGSSCSPTASPSTRSGSGASSWSTRVTPTPSCKTFSRRCAPGRPGARTCLSRCASIRRSSRLVHASRVHTMSRPLDRCPGGVRRSKGRSAAPCQKHNGTFRGTAWGVAGLLPDGAMPPGGSPRPRPGPRADAAT